MVLYMRLTGRVYCFHLMETTSPKSLTSNRPTPVKFLAASHGELFASAPIWLPSSNASSPHDKSRLRWLGGKQTMRIRAARISTAILEAISSPGSSGRPSWYGYLAAFFSFFSLPLARYRAGDFSALRQHVWHLDEHGYVEAFLPAADLVPVGDLGYSGSTFFTTPNAKYLIKSLPRRFEHQFFTHDLFGPYVAHMRARPGSLLVGIVDMVYTPLPTLGGIIGTAPTHHIVMENVLYGKEHDPAGPAAWETYDLKPADYFFPERDILDGRLAPESVKDRLVDEFKGKVRITTGQREELLSILELDTKVLEENNAVDYSFFLVRYPGPSSQEGRRDVPCLAGGHGDAWRRGVDDVDGKWTYRAVVLDFFWAKHKFRAKAMTGLVSAWDAVTGHGPMSITAEPAEYRRRFMKMVGDLFVAS
jgi:hypothetical protein